MAPSQVTHTFKPSENPALSPSRVIGIRQSANHSVITVAASEVTDRVSSTIGTPYRWGDITPKRGFNCNGPVSYAFQDVDDVDLPWTACAIYNVDNNRVSRGELQPGDLVSSRIRSRSVDHVGIYVDSNRFVHVPWCGKKVRVSDLNNSYWKHHYLAGRCILPTTLAQIESIRKR